MAIDRAPGSAPRASDGLTLTGLLDVLERAEPLPLQRPRPSRAVLHRSVPARSPRPLPPARPVLPPRPRPATGVLPAQQPAPAPAVLPTTAARPTLRSRLRALTRRLALWGAGPGGAHLAWGPTAPPRVISLRPVAVPAPVDRPVVLTELPSTPTVQPAASSPAAALSRVPRPRSAGSPRTAATPPPTGWPAPRPAPCPSPPSPSGWPGRSSRPDPRATPGSARAPGRARTRGDPPACRVRGSPGPSG
ncbi:hypothetical protein [Blastococcus sp. SYSU D00820]